MLSVDFKSKIGEMRRKQNGINYKTILYSANCLYAEIFEDGDERTLFSFAADEQHLKNMLKDDAVYGEVTHIYFYQSKLEEDKRLWKVVKLFTKYGIDVTIDHR